MLGLPWPLVDGQLIEKTGDPPAPVDPSIGDLSLRLAFYRKGREGKRGMGCCCLLSNPEVAEEY